LEHALPGIYINARVSRAMIAGVALVRQLAADRRLRPVVIVGLGTNGPVSSDQIRQLRMAVGSRWLILINVFEQRPWAREVNTTLAAAATRYPNVLLVNWHAAIEHRTGLLWSDGIHPQPSGGRLYAGVVRAAVLAALRSWHPRESRSKPKPRQRPLVFHRPHNRRAAM
jgi:lysophospholipase L1-like esterase